jgi:NAD(P)-dependent dehydrogenase (short-subunit alcohol dehydrogenase family)
MARFIDKIAVVTGASKGIGAGIAKRLAAEGASVVVNYSSSKDGRRLHSRCSRPVVAASLASALWPA